jgi:DNA-binding IclR family transcriptional regulator
LTVRDGRAAAGLHLDQDQILDYLAQGPKTFAALRRRLDILGSDTRPSESRRQLADLIDRGLIEEFEDSQFRLAAPGFAVAPGTA